MTNNNLATGHGSEPGLLGRNEISDLQSGFRLDPRRVRIQKLESDVPDRGREQFREIERPGIRKRPRRTVRSSPARPDPSQATTSGTS